MQLLSCTRVPVELWRIILEESCSSPSSCAAVARVSSFANRIAIPALYKRLTISTEERLVALCNDQVPGSCLALVKEMAFDLEDPKPYLIKSSTYHEKEHDEFLATCVMKRALVVLLQRTSSLMHLALCPSLLCSLMWASAKWARTVVLPAHLTLWKPSQGESIPASIISRLWASVLYSAGEDLRGLFARTTHLRFHSSLSMALFCEDDSRKFTLIGRIFPAAANLIIADSADDISPSGICLLGEILSSQVDSSTLNLLVYHTKSTSKSVDVWKKTCETSCEKRRREAQTHVVIVVDEDEMLDSPCALEL
jgi:hypothetical protein